MHEHAACYFSFPFPDSTRHDFPISSFCTVSSASISLQALVVDSHRWMILMTEYEAFAYIAWAICIGGLAYE
jgi:hypothetical protein